MAEIHKVDVSGPGNRDATASTEACRALKVILLESSRLATFYLFYLPLCNTIAVISSETCWVANMQCI